MESQYAARLYIGQLEEEYGHTGHTGENRGENSHDGPGYGPHRNPRYSSVNTLDQAIHLISRFSVACIASQLFCELV